MKRSFEQRPPAPRRVRNGVRLRGDGRTPRGWVAVRWAAALDGLLPARARRDGLEYARLGQVARLEVLPGRVEARVQGRAAHQYRTCLRIGEFTAAQWQEFNRAMAAEAFYAAKLLARDVPPALDDLLGSMGLSLVPGAAEVVVECDCPTGGGCKHAAAVGYLVAERLDDDPLEAFVLRGRPVEQVLEQLALARTDRARGIAVAHADPVPPHAARRAARPLEDCLDSFWRPGPELAELQKMPPPHHAPHALLRRLGPSPLPGRFPLVGLLASVYDTVAEQAVHLRDRAERLETDE